MSVNLLNKLFAFIKISRPLNAFITFISIIVASLICTTLGFPFLKVILAAAAGGFTAAAGNVINDIFDIQIDKLNKPNRPLANNTLTKNSAIAFYILLNFVSLVLALWVGFLPFLIVLITIAVLFVYSSILKRKILLGNITIAFLTGLAFVYGGVVVGNWKLSIIPAAFAFVINLIREIVKDMEDKEGDSKLGVITFPQKFGFALAKKTILFFSVLLIAATFFPYVLGIYNIKFFLIVMIIVNPLIVYMLRSLFIDDSVKNLNKLSSLLKLSMLFGLAAIYFGR